jgi:hypothetical protein
VSTTAGINFLVVNANASIPAGGTTAAVQGIQGTWMTVSYVSNGSTTQTYNINDVNVENSVSVNLLATVASQTVASAIQQQTTLLSSYVVANADGTYSVYALNNPGRSPTFFVSVIGSGGIPVVWNQQSSFVDSTNLSTDYVLRPELNGTITVLFGNGVFGAYPLLGQTVIVQYVQSIGLAGNVFTNGTINTINSPLYYAGTSTQVSNITVSNTGSFIGGANAETVTQIKQNAPQVFATGNRAVTKADFVALIENYAPGCNIVVYGENDITPPNYNMYNQVRICMIVPTANVTPNINSWGVPSVTFQSNLAAYLYSKSLITVRYSFITPTIVFVMPELTVRVNPTSAITSVQGLVEQAIQNEFVLGTTTALGQNIYQSDIIEAVESVPGVFHSHVTLKLMKPLAQGYNSNYAYATNADLLPVMTGKVELWVNTTQIAYDDGTGGWTNIGGSGSTVSGLVEYAGVNTTSASSVAIGLGSKTFTVTAGLKMVYGTTLTITYNGANNMVGTIVSYTSTTLVVNVTSITGTGTYASWTIIDNTALIGVNFSLGAPAIGSTVFIKYQQDNSALTPNSVGDLVVGQTQIVQWSSDVYDYIGY